MELDLDSTPVDWSATSPDSGRVTPAPQGSTLAEPSQRVAVLCSIGEGCVEVGFPDRDYPLLTLGFRARHAVVHLFTSDNVLLLVGDGSDADDEDVQVPILDELGTFTGDFVTDVDPAWNLLRTVILVGSASHVGTWHEL